MVFTQKNFIKPTAVERVFLNGTSYHPSNVFKAIVFSESTRLRRLCERDVDYTKAIKALQQKCFKSGFNKDLVNGIIKTTIDWKERFPPKTAKLKTNAPTVWPTHFPRLLKLTKQERYLNPNALITYKRP